MIKGRKLTLKEIQRNQKSSEAFLDFIYLVENAELSVTGSDQKQTYEFNGFPTSEAFENKLIRLFEENTEVIRSSVRNIFDKDAKLEEINFYIEELELLEINCKQDGDSLRHSNFKIKPDSSSHDLETLSKSKIVRKCLSVIKFYISKSIKYFKNFRDDIRQTSQSDFAMPEYLQPKSIDSSDANPFRYFEYLIAQNGIVELKKKLMTLPEDDDQHHMIVDRANEVITYYIYEDGIEKELVKKVSDLIVKKIEYQTECTKELLNAASRKFTSLKDAQEYFKIQTPELKRLFHGIPNKHSVNSVLKQQLIIIAEFILNQFNEFLENRPKNILQHILDYKNKANQTIAPHRYPYAFDLQNVSIEKLMELSSTHLKSIYITEQELPLLRNVFTGEKDKKKIKRISWQYLYNGHTSKRSLIYLFHKLQESQLIKQVTPTELKKRLVQLFCNEDGTSFKTTIQRNYKDFEADNGNHPKIDQLIQLLKS